MKTLVFLLLLFFSTSISLAIDKDTTAILFMKKQGKRTFAVSKHTVWEWKNNKLTSAYHSIDPIVDFLPVNDNLLVCTAQSLNLITAEGKNIPIKHHLIKNEFVALCLSPLSKPLVATRFYGLFSLEADSLKRFYEVYPVNTIQTTADSSLWIGTDVGLHKLKNNTVVIYKEEGVSNYEIADNHIAKLIPDNQGDLWVQMTEAVSVMSVAQKQEHHEHLPTIRYLGNPTNELYSVSFHEKLGYLFSTKEGMLLMPLNKKDDNHKYFELVEEIAQGSPNTNLGVLKRVYFNGKILRTNHHIITSKGSFIIANGNKLMKISTKKLLFN